MEQFTIQTTQNISIEQPLASIGERITATIIDFAIMGAYLIITLVVTGLSEHRLASIIFSSPLLFYHLVFELAMNGQSPGKSIMKIRVLAEDGSAPTFTSIFIRWLFRLIDITMMFGAIATLFIISTKKNQRLGDITGRTILLSTQVRKKFGSMLYNLPSDYKLRYSEVEMLSDNDIHVIREVINFLQKTVQNEESRLYALKTKASIIKKTGIQTNQNPDEFLITLLKDYNYIHARKQQSE